ncbi:MAG: hypothetical protein H0U53_09480 [Actinobacteria bacterium]|nr:hypothetical protein [Actinomycetota bacterium]
MFDYKTATEEEILLQAIGLLGNTVGSISDFTFSDKPAAQSRGEVGLAIERFFGIPQNNRQEADFPSAGIELKIVPVEKSANRYKVKERTSLTQINFKRLVDEDWKGAQLRKKLRVLFVFFEHRDGVPKSSFPIKGTHLWFPTPEEEALIGSDWLAIQNSARLGRAHELSEADGIIMGAATKGGSGQMVEQAVSAAPLAKSRAFALKPAFLKRIFDVHIAGAAEGTWVTAGRELPRVVEERLGRFVGMRLSEAARALTLQLGQGKGSAGHFIRLALGAQTSRSPIEELERAGMTVKTVRVTPEGRPYEATSFPHFLQKELAAEVWEESTLLYQLEGGIVFVPLVGVTRDTPREACVIGRPTVWKPDAGVLEKIRREWETFQASVRTDEMESSPKESETSLIHVRPHATTGQPLDKTVSGRRVKKHSFWLNKSYVQQVIGKPVLSP